MKKEFLLLFAFCNVLAFQLSAQVDFAPVGAKWYYSWATNSIPEDPEREVGYIKLASLKDTLLNGQTCRKLQRTWIHTDYHNSDAPIDTGTSYLYLYSDSNAVFYYDGVLARFIPLYMFNVKVGDTATYRVPTRFDFLRDTLFSMLITDITTSTIGGVPLKTIHHESLNGMMGFGSSLNDPYTEKLGSLIAFLLCHQPLGHILNYTPSLRCYIDSEINYQRDRSIPCDYIEGASNVDRIIADDKAINIYPNPTSSLLNLELSSITGLRDVQLFDISGRKVIVSGSNSVLNLGDLTAGVYFLKVSTTNGTITRKVVVSK